MISIVVPCLAKDALGVQWLHEAIASVHEQGFKDWEMIVVNDHSPADLSAVKKAWPRVRWLEAELKGVSAARNQAAEAARGDLLLPLDADDKLAANALAAFAAAWGERGEAGIIYSDVVMFGEDYAQVYLAPEYSFQTLLGATFMTVGCLHRKADWERVGGWRLDMSQGLEDWEYWIALGEMGVCGKRLAEPLYWYRRHPRGRLQWLKANHELWNRAYQAMREIHRNSYNGRYPVGCCGGKAPKGAKRPLHGGVPEPMPMGPAALSGAGVVQMVYRGVRQGDFMLVGGVTRTRYRVPGRGELVEQVDGRKRGVLRADVEWFRSVAQGRDFHILEAPKPAPALQVHQPPVAVREAVRPVEPTIEAWTPAILEGHPVEPSSPEPEEEETSGSAKRTRRTRSG